MRVVALMLALTLGGCGDDGADPSSRFELNGTINDEAPLNVSETFAVVRLPGSPLSPASLTRLDVYAFEDAPSSVACPEIPEATSRGLHLIAEVAALEVGEIPFEGRGAGRGGGIPRFDVTWSGDTTAPATGGTLQLDQVDDVVRGTFTILFGEETVTGSFEAPRVCDDAR